ncbi:CBS domain-containing protein [Falsiroseomonas sp. HW251]|uniref:CBS domain-containing protein n=1 Tax=Falsiroseomonas sp. HW251 TaxID=3390998 RepID=UPI003D30F5C9
MLSRPVSEMIRGQVPLTAPPGATVREASQRMAERYVGSVLVTDEAGRLLGIFTERDAVCRVLATSRDADATTLAEVMTTKVATIRPRATAMDALRMMQDGGFRHVPVVEADQALGVVSWTDFRGREYARLEDESALWAVVR